LPHLYDKPTIAGVTHPNQHVPFWPWLWSGRRFFPAILAAVVLAALTVAVPVRAPGDESLASGGTGTTEFGTGSDGTAAAPGTTTTGQTGTSGIGVTGPSGAGAPGTGVSGPAGVAPGSSATGPGSGSTSTASANSYFGVTATTVKWGFSAQDKGCGGFNQSAAAAAYGSSSTPAVDYQAAQEYFNKYPLEGIPLPPAIRANVNGKTGYWGRKIVSVFRDSGGFACPDVGRANAVTMAEQDKVFGLIMRGNEGPEVPMSQVMAQHKRIFIGRQLVGPLWFKQRAPYFWDGMWGEGSSENIALGSWVCRDWAGRKASDTGDPTVTGKDRKFGTLMPDDPGFRELAGILQKELDRCGVKSAQYSYPFDLQTLESSAQTVVNRMHQDGITTVLMLTDFLSPLFLTKAATGQQWHPEWVRSGWGLGGYGHAYRTFMTPDQARNAWAAADSASIATPAYHKSEAYLAWKRVRPDAEPDGDWPSYYYQFKLLALGMAGAGRNLTPETFGQGLAAVCNPCARSDKRLPLNRLYPGHWTNLDGFTLVKYNPNKPDPTAPPDNTGNAPMGYFDFLEGGKRYGLRITDPET
jgi:hypothetical protein